MYGVSCVLGIMERKMAERRIGYCNEVFCAKGDNNICGEISIGEMWEDFDWVFQVL